MQVEIFMTCDRLLGSIPTEVQVRVL